MYRFDWEAPGIGAAHAVDVPFTFGTFDRDGWGDAVGADDRAERLGRTIRDAWCGVRGDGRPEPRRDPRLAGPRSRDPAHPPASPRRAGSPTTPTARPAPCGWREPGESGGVSGRHEAEHALLLRHHVQLAIAVLAEGRHRRQR